ncbi:MAG TPA: DUF551 domain-containing protein [Firmicutes bacterium]|nr:DUF551 domain-containing protein [Bacillota bacterium]
MQELEKILEEVDVKIAGSMGKRREGLLEAEEIIRKHIKNEEDILKFYYCESEDDYYIGKRVQNMYYAKYEPGGFTWFMSRYLPWGTDGYPSEPKEIPFTEWLDGFICKHMNDGWIPVEERLPEEGQEVWVSTKTDCVRRGMYTRYFGAKHRGGFICSDGFMWMNIANAWQPYVVPEPYRPERSEK